MKRKLSILLGILLAISNIKAQEQTFTQMVDSVFANVSRVDATTGILYERVLPFSGLARFGVTNNSADTINADVFLQGYSEMYNAAFDSTKRLTLKLENLEGLIIKDTSLIDIALFHYKYNTFDTAMIFQKLYFDADSIVRENTTIAGSLYAENEVFIASPMIAKSKFSTITFRLSNTFQFDNTTNPIVMVEIDFDDGNGYQSVNLTSTTTISYNSDGEKTIKVKVTFANNQETISVSKLTIPNNMQKAINCDNVWAATDTVSTPPIPWSGYGESVSYKGKLKIYYANTLHPKLMKPILIVDGFDPGNKRKCDICEEDAVAEKTIWDQLKYGNNQHVGEQLLNLGYDLVFLDLPEGGGYIEANAMVCIKAINMINDSLKANGSKEEIVIVGPSMGGQITRYALTYMETHPNLASTNYGKHNCRLWVSYDSPHQGANISMGAQHLIHYFNKIKSVKPIWENTLCCMAAKQMLIYHALGSSGNYGATQTKLDEHTNYYDSLHNLNTATNGYPVNLRKIAVSNGSFNSSSNGNAGELAYKTTLWWSEFAAGTILDIRLRNMTNSGAGKEYVKSVNYWFGIIPICVSKKFNNNSGMCSIDCAPGGTFNSFDQINDNINLGNTTAINQHSHCFMPVPSTLDISGNMDYCTDISNRDLVAEGRTPFQSYAGSTDTNMMHVSFNGNLTDYLTNEIETYVYGADTISLCGGTSNYTMHLRADKISTTTVTWTCSPNLQIVSAQGSATVIVRPTGIGNAWIEATSSNLSHNKQLKRFAIHIVDNSTYPVENATTINSEVVWTTPRTIAKQIVVGNGATLTITSTTIEFLPNAGIFINPTGKLVLNGATLTNACDGKMWRGIEVCNYPYSNTNQTWAVQMNNSLIENAVCAIGTVLIGPTRASSVIATNSTFKNNSIALQFLENLSTGNAVSTFSNCTFITDANYMGSATVTPNDHILVKMHRNNGKIFSGCSFTNTSSQNWRGIVAEDAGFMVREKCTNPDEIISSPPCDLCADYTASSFSGFSKAIDVNNAGNQVAFVVKRTDFAANNTYRINVASSNNYKVTYSNFKFSVPNPTGKTMANYGIYSQNSSGYDISNNNFYQSSSILAGSNFGIVMRNSGTANNIIILNKFENLNTGLNVMQTNGSTSGTPSGLTFSCNYFVGNKYDISLSQNSTIKSNQGSSTSGANNSFVGTQTSSIYSGGNQLINYYHRNSTPYIPYNPTNAYITPIATTSSPHLLACDYVQCLVAPKNALQQYQDLQNNNQNGSRDSEMTQLSNAAIHALMTDSLPHLDELKQWYSIINTPIAKYSLAETNFELKNYAEAENVLAEIPAMFEFGDKEQIEHNNYLNFHNFKKNLIDSERSYYDLTDAELTNLKQIATTNGRSATMAKGVLCFFYGICLEDEEENFEEGGEIFYAPSQQNSSSEEEIAEENNIVYPNPTDNLIYFDNFAKKSVSLHNSNGILLETTRESFMDLSKYSAGTYFLNINSKMVKVVKK